MNLEEMRLQMNLNDSIESLFPAENDIPERFRLEEPIRQTEYLIDGEIKHWKGDSNPVYSPVCLKSSAETAKIYGRISPASRRSCLEGSKESTPRGRGFLGPTKLIS